VVQGVMNPWYRRVPLAALLLLASCKTAMVVGPNPDSRGTETTPGLQVASTASMTLGLDVRLSTVGHACIIRGGKVACWGPNHFRQLGHLGGSSCNGLACSPSPCFVNDLPPARSVVVGESTSCILDMKGEVSCWGQAHVGQFGPTPTERCGNELNSWPCTERPTRIAGIRGAIGLAVSSHVCVVTSAEEVLCWGANDSGQLGRPSKDSCVPNLAVTRDGRGMQMPSVSLPCSRLPLRVEGIPAARQVVVGRSHTCALTVAGEVYCWGSNDRGEVGIGSKAKDAPPTRVSGLTDITSVAAGMHNTCAIQRGGRLYCWGINNSGQLGFEPNDQCLDMGLSCSRIPGKVTENVVEVGCGFTHGCARHSDGSVSCWGLDSDGQLGFTGNDKCNKGRQSCAATPRKVPHLKAASALSVGHGFSCVIRDQNVECWGRNALGMLGDGSTESRPDLRPVIEAESCR
jgi:alpha-tubulin suppressor-like RCC1 family protein